MGFLKGRLNFRRYQISDPLPDDFRDRFEQALTDHGFRDPMSATKGEETVGWVLPDNLLDTDFSNRDRWLFNHYLLGAVRVDKKTLPAALVRAMVERRVQQWCEENSRAHAPASVRADIRINIESDLIARTLPQVRLIPFCWNLAEGWLLFESTSNRMNDCFRTLFRRTFGLTPEPFTPLEFLTETPHLVDPIAAAGMTVFGGGGQ
jgi:DNA recombination-dependent growth factor C